MANIKQTDVASNQNSGSSIAKAVTGGNELPPITDSHLELYSINQKATGIEPHTAQAEVEVKPEEWAPQNNGGAGNLSSENERIRNRTIASAVTALNDYVQNEQRDLEFIVKNEAGIPVVKITNRNSGELIRQIPGEEVVDLARKLNDQEPLRLFSAQV